MGSWFFCWDPQIQISLFLRLPFFLQKSIFQLSDKGRSDDSRNKQLVGKVLGASGTRQSVILVFFCYVLIPT